MVETIRILLLLLGLCVLFIGCSSNMPKDEIALLNEYTLPGTWKMEKVSEPPQNPFVSELGNQTALATIHFYDNDIICATSGAMSWNIKGRPDFYITFVNKWEATNYSDHQAKQIPYRDCYNRCVPQSGAMMVAARGPTPQEYKCSKDCHDMLAYYGSLPDFDTEHYSVYVFARAGDIVNITEYVSRDTIDCYNMTLTLLSQIKRDVFNIEVN